MGLARSERVVRYGIGTVVGVVAYWLGYALVYLLGDVQGTLDAFRAGFASGASETMGSLGITPPSTFHVGGWLFYQAHFVSSEATLTVGTASRSFVQSLGLRGFVYLLPALALLGASYLFARVLIDSGVPSLVAGLSLAPGYFLMGLAGVELFTWTITFPGTARTAASGPQPLLAVILFAIYGVVFGAAGGLLAARGGPLS